MTMENDESTSDKGSSKDEVTEPALPGAKTPEELAKNPEDAIDENIVKEMGAEAIKSEDLVDPPEHASKFELHAMTAKTLGKKLSASSQMGEGVDEAKWNKAKEISKQTYGEERWPFIQWLTPQL